MSSESVHHAINSPDRSEAGVAVFSRVGQRDAFASDTLEAVPNGWKMLIRNPWYTGTFLSTVSFIKVKINGYEVPEESILISLRGQTVPAIYAKNLYEIWWGMGEVAELFLTDAGIKDILTEKNAINIDMDVRTAFSYGFKNDVLPYRLTGELEVK